MPTYLTKGTCSKKITFEVADGVITACNFQDGCDGNLIGLSKLVLNRPVREVIDLLEGIQCRNGTSCPDQLARALRQHEAAR